MAMASGGPVPLATLLPLLAAAQPCFAVAYLWFALALGPRLMQGREPLRLRPLLAVYNAVQVVLNGMLVARSVLLFMDRRYDTMCPRATPPLEGPYASVDDRAFAHEVTLIAQYQGVIRLLDLADTVFIVLAKKNSHLTFLHLYHHFSVVLFSWAILRIDPGGAATLVPASINNFVHALMYFYYLLTLLGVQIARSAKKYLTQLQIFQFVLVILYLLQAFFRKGCDTSLAIVALNFCQGTVFFWLFLQFYRGAYKAKKEV